MNSDFTGRPITASMESYKLVQRITRLERMVGVSRMLSSTLDLTQLLQLIIQTAAELVGAEAASILLEDERTGELFFAASTGAAEEELLKIQVPVDGSIAGTVFSSGKPLTVHDVRQDPRHFGGVDQNTQFETRSILGVPLQVRTRCIGVLEALNKLGNSTFDDEDVRILSTMASQAAVAIENARLVTRLRDANRRLSELDELKTKFISIASHELRTPLMIVLGYASFLREQDQGDMGEELDMVLRSARKLQTIIDQMTNLNYLETGGVELQQECFVLQSLLEEVAEEWRPLLESKQLEVRMNLPATLIEVCADRAQVSLVVSNLLNNAFKFTPENGRIEIGVRPHTGKVAVSVVDTGVGITPENLNRIFERFYQVENYLVRHHGGLGLGLSISKEVIEQHGGRIWAESVPGRGSRFTFTLPIDWGKSQSRRPPSTL